MRKDELEELISALRKNGDRIITYIEEEQIRS
jgi:hypothetical protein